MSHLICFVLGIIGYAFYDFLKCEWEVKRHRKRQQLPKAFINKKVN
jgi:hypothetical protein